MKPLRIRAEMGSAIALPGSRDIHFDALLGWVWMVRHHPDRLASLSRQSLREETIRPHLPLGLVRVGRHVAPMASAWLLPDGARLATVSFTRRKDGDDLDMRERTINASSPDRSMMVRVDTVEVSYVDWIVWGIKREIKSACKLLHHVGGMGRHGYGVVQRWTIEDGDHSATDTWVRDGRAARNLPVDALSGISGEIERLAVEPPYWPPCMHVPAVGPGTSVTLSSDVLSQLQDPPR